MLNTMPLPIGPTEIPSGSARPEMGRKAPISGTKREGGTSFASTLEAAHKNDKATGDGVNHKSGDTSGAQSASEDKDVAQKEENCVVSADGVLCLVAQEQAIPNNDLDLKLSAYNFETVTTSEATSAVSEIESVNAAVGLQEETIAAPDPNTPDLQKKTGATLHSKTAEFVAPRQPAGANAEAQGAANGQDVVQDTLLQEGQNTFKTLKGVVDADKSGLGPQVSHSAVDQSSQASQVLEAAVPDKKMTPKTQQNTSDGLTEKAAKVDTTLSEPFIDEGEPHLSNKDNSTSQLHHKGTENRKTELETPTPGKFKDEVLDFQTVRSQKTEDSAAGSKAFGAKTSETPIHLMNDEASPMAGRQGVLDPALSFSTSHAGGKIDMASGHTTAASVMNTDIFHQENFHQLVERALFTVRGEQSEARIALKPDHLGHVQMRIVTENHLVSIKIVTETPAARDLIDANANQLKAELQHQGLNVENIEVSVSDERHDAYRQARQRDSFLRHMTSQGRSTLEGDREIIEHGPAQRKKHRNNAAGIDYFA